MKTVLLGDITLIQKHTLSAKNQIFINLIKNGKEITVPEKDVTICRWTGTGYIVMNPETGTGVYMIDGGLSGGFFASLETILLIILIMAVSTLVVYLAPYIVAFLKVYIIGLKNILLSLMVLSSYLAYKFTPIVSILLGGLINLVGFCIWPVDGKKEAFVQGVVFTAISEFIIWFLNAIGGLLFGTLRLKNNLKLCVVKT